ncbi:hypothetical protein ACJX0J_017750, partial [Zea mays]
RDIILESHLHTIEKLAYIRLEKELQQAAQTIKYDSGNQKRKKKGLLLKNHIEIERENITEKIRLACVFQRTRQSILLQLAYHCALRQSISLHQEQMSLIIRYESFVGFLEVNDTTGQGLFDHLGLDIDNLSILLCANIREALLQVSDSDNDPLTSIIWYEILYQINYVSKDLQAKDMLIDAAIQKVQGLISFFNRYRESGFLNTLEEAKGIAHEMEIDTTFRKKRVLLTIPVTPIISSAGGHKINYSLVRAMHTRTSIYVHVLKIHFFVFLLNF